MKNLLVNFIEKLIRLLKKYHECFAWIATDMLGIDPNVTCHKLAIDPKVKQVQRKKRRHGPE